MTWEEFSEKYHVRPTDKCCASCKHGEGDFDGMAKCYHPLVKDNGSICNGGNLDSVCDLWEKKE